MAYYIYRDNASDAFDPSTPLNFFPPKDSDELFFALRHAYPSVPTHQERMRTAVIDFLLNESSQTPATSFHPLDGLSAFASGSESAQSPFLTTESSSGASSDSPSLFDPTLSTMSSPQTASLRRQSSQASTTESPAPMSQMTSVFSITSHSQPKLKTRRKMTDSEKIEYRKRRSAGACQSCSARKRKCKHGEAQTQASSATSSKPTSKAMSAKARGKRPEVSEPITDTPAPVIDTSASTLAYSVPDLLTFDSAFAWQTTPDWTLLDTPAIGQDASGIEDYLHTDSFETSPQYAFPTSQLSSADPYLSQLQSLSTDGGLRAESSQTDSYPQAQRSDRDIVIGGAQADQHARPSVNQDGGLWQHGATSSRLPPPPLNDVHPPSPDLFDPSDPGDGIAVSSASFPRSSGTDVRRGHGDGAARRGRGLDGAGDETANGDGLAGGVPAGFNGITAGENLAGAHEPSSILGSGELTSANMAQSSVVSVTQNPVLAASVLDYVGPALPYSDQSLCGSSVEISFLAPRGESAFAGAGSSRGLSSSQEQFVDGGEFITAGNRLEVPTPLSVMASTAVQVGSPIQANLSVLWMVQQSMLAALLSALEKMFERHQRTASSSFQDYDTAMDRLADAYGGMALTVA